MMNPPTCLRIARAFIGLNALLWAAFAIAVALGLHPSYPDPGILRWSMALIAAGTAIILSMFLRSLAKHRTLAYWLAIAFLAVIALAALLDEVGIADILFIIITGVPIILLLRSRSWYLHPNSEPKQERAA
jgi:hypothetical protein